MCRETGEGRHGRREGPGVAAWAASWGSPVFTLPLGDPRVFNAAIDQWY